MSLCYFLLKLPNFHPNFWNNIHPGARARSDTSPDNLIRGAHGVTGAGASKRRREAESQAPGVVTALVWLDENLLASAGDKDGCVKVIMMKTIIIMMTMTMMMMMMTMMTLMIMMMMKMMTMMIMMMMIMIMMKMILAV